ncbi:GNAT family N-acetyltransferase [Avibacterium paragallinarum]|uniref:GNAT family N-acetyltransferase n=2 Tax=Pasteurellaceae TaxID=712 RepID=A0ABU7QI06_AVIPA|nr:MULTISPECIES: GNAT family N-acetyltransferase [Pasteurellaceae]OBP21290.1 GCN5 family acetyltransferase [Pasteurella multocida subsp. multocida]QCA40383.1 N-acetyltransferase [Pasteurella multocida]UWZ95075.1 GNAT family N-acetyltransferase [Pasteurella multocida subsp. multocida]HDX0975794.1 GNAT family N-acetyltransferase [Pasteurella multocida]HDX0976648.1 GNAT family N-acetyltransferase [Pasteurella multocida]
MLPNIKITAFDKTYLRDHFDCGVQPLNQYLQKQVSQDIKRRIASCFTVVDEHHRILGYYTLASTSIPLVDLPESLKKKLPRYPSVPAVLLGRLAVDKQAKGYGLGKALLGNALKRIIRSDIAAYALIVDAKDQSAVNFYQQFGFIPFSKDSHKLFFPLANINLHLDREVQT